MLLQSLTVDAGDVEAGAVLLQEGDDTIDHPVAHFSKKHQNNYSTIEKEALTLSCISDTTFCCLYCWWE